MDWKKLIGIYGSEYMMRQLAEECAELAQAALKLIRAENGETPMREDEAMEHLLEEIADVLNMILGIRSGILDTAQNDAVYEIANAKLERMADRMLCGNMGHDIW